MLFDNYTKVGKAFKILFSVFFAVAAIARA